MAYVKYFDLTYFPPLRRAKYPKDKELHGHHPTLCTVTESQCGIGAGQTSEYKI